MIVSVFSSSFFSSSFFLVFILEILLGSFHTIGVRSDIEKDQHKDEVYKHRFH